ncbi:ACR3 family arsenite efflux transporter [Acetohalobium arabaticum]|uniref:Arsenical-resistance protein n=1 Tax=Acetohalobium arabaticum (strain ATCC 49924 / DSM 5501 / Z-7288) TaxID=574087 RepID=D9QT24_ACEAZ|nr:ACR3 family arsenite efflux transporter [Acetohalobium arabaticum]ADL13524.1 arsenical-resistance protein [Acetohalobium arabaticum DSM 5501]
MSQEKMEVKEETEGLGFFEKYLTLWVAICIAIGIGVGRFLSAIPETLSRFEYAQVNIPVAVLIWFMIYPMMVQIDFSSIIEAGKKPKGLGLTLVVNWLIKPFTMAFFGWLFLKNIFGVFISPELADQYVAGMILLGSAPCTAMVFVWSYLTDGDANYTLIQVAVNDLVLVFAYAPLVMLLLGVTDFNVPYDTVLLSVVLYIIVPLVAGYLSRRYIIKNKGIDWLENVYLKKLDNFTIVGLLLTLIILFAFQGDIILNNPFDILLIAIPLTIQTFFVFILGYGGAKLLKLEHPVAAPASMIGASNFFELAVATAISIFGLTSGAALATVVGVLVEVPVMLALVAIANRTKHWFPQKSKA